MIAEVIGDTSVTFPENKYLFELGGECVMVMEFKEKPTKRVIDKYRLFLSRRYDCKKSDFEVFRVTKEEVEL